MSNIVKNVKGNTGYMLAIWNIKQNYDPAAPVQATLTTEQRSDLLHYDGVVKLSISPVTVRACGKKSMRLACPQVPGIHNWSWHPDYPLYKTIEDAKAAAPELFSKISGAEGLDFIVEVR